MDAPLTFPLGGRSIPPADIYLTTDEMTILVTLPSMTKEHLQLTIQKNQIEIAGLAEEPHPNARYLTKERLHGPFQRSIEIPADYDINKAKASYQNGTLKIIIPRTPDSEKPVLHERKLVAIPV
jgi:HSP20 family protein